MTGSRVLPERTRSVHRVEGRSVVGSSPMFNLIPLSDALGAEVRGLDLRMPMDGAIFDALHRAWLEHIVLLFRDQVLDDHDLVGFSRRFGELEIAPLFQGRRFIDDFPEVMIVSNVVDAGQPLGSLGTAEAFWHCDLNFIEEPPDHGFLYALEVPASGGDTGFANMYKALETLPPSLRPAIEGRRIKHDARFNSAGYLREETRPDVIHPIVRTHPETGRKALFLGRRLNAMIVGVPPAESEVLLDALWSHATQPRFIWHHKWRPRDLVMWDNRVTMHRRDSFDPSARRVMHRTQTKGTRPYS